MSTLKVDVLRDTAETVSLDVVDLATASTLRQDLSASAGAELIGWERSQLVDQISTVSQMLSSQAVSIWEFADSAYKPVIEPSGWIWDGAFAAAIAAQPAGGGAIELVDGETYLVNNITSTKPFLRIQGRGIIKANPNATGAGCINYQVDGGTLELDRVRFDGNKLNQATGRPNVFTRYASVYCNRVTSENAQFGYRITDSPSVIMIDCNGRYNGFATSAGEAVNQLGIGTYIERSNNVRVIRGDYSSNSWNGVRVNGNFQAISAPDWQATTAYTVGDIAAPLTKQFVYLRCKVAGTTGGVAPTGLTPGVDFVDGTVTWEVLSPLCNNVLIHGVRANSNYGDFGGTDQAIGVTVAVARNVIISDSVAQFNEGNNFDTNRVLYCEVVNCTGTDSAQACGYNPDYSQDKLGLAGGFLKIIGGEFSRNVRGLLIQLAFQSPTVTPLYRDVLVQGVRIAENSAVGLSASCIDNFVMADNTLRNNGVAGTGFQVNLADTTINAEAAANAVWGRLRISGNTFDDTRSTPCQAHVLFSRHTNASNPNYSMTEVAARRAFIVDNDFSTNTLPLFTSATKGVSPWYSYARIQGNRGLGPRMYFTTADVVANSISMEAQELVYSNLTAATTITTLTGGVEGQELTIYNSSAFNLTIGASGNIKPLTGAATVFGTNGICRLKFMNGNCWQL